LLSQGIKLPRQGYNQTVINFLYKDVLKTGINSIGQKVVYLDFGSINNWLSSQVNFAM
jgi:hypothetical protein